jgi:hypothetical protein
LIFGSTTSVSAGPGVEFFSERLMSGTCSGNIVDELELKCGSLNGAADFAFTLLTRTVKSSFSPLKDSRRPALEAHYQLSRIDIQGTRISIMSSTENTSLYAKIICMTEAKKPKGTLKYVGKSVRHKIFLQLFRPQ